tara:strand:- start:2848 stop:3663 length:816 start_codon:yes stop_codon:yes gene_type:complete
MAANLATLSGDHEHRKVSLSPANSEIVKNVNLVYYAPEVVMLPHSHATAQFSTLLCGQSVEVIGSRKVENRYGVAEFKPTDFSHSNYIGKEGALLLSINLDDQGDAFKTEFGNVNWHLSDITGAQTAWRYLRNLIFKPAESCSIDLEEIILGLLSITKPYRGNVKMPPHWLKLAVQALHDDNNIGISDIASSVGVHRVHLSRVFHSHFGVPISHYRQKIRIQRSLSSLLYYHQGLAQTSSDSGFSDQSHFTRVLKRHFNIPPSQLVSLFSR